MARKTKIDLSGVLLKLDRAEEHIQTVGSQLETFLKRNPAPFGFRPKERPRAGKAVEYTLYAVIREEPPRKLALPIGDALQNIRAALDHLAYELSSSRAQKSGNTAFPIYTDECRFKVNGVPYIETIKGDERTLIEHVQPYAASKVPRNDPLAILRQLSNLDKHRLLIPVIAAVSTRDSWIGSDNADVHFTYFSRGPVKHDTKIMACIASPKDPAVDMKVQPQSGLQIQLSNTGTVGLDIEALELLQMLHHHVRHTIIGMWFEYGLMPKTWAEVQGIS